MEYVPSESTLVLAGAWNAAILSPPWVQLHGLGRPADQQGRVQVLIPALAGMYLEPPRFSLDEFSYSVRPNEALVISAPAGPQNFEVWEGAAAGVLEVLQYTPVTGVGHNFEFRDAAPVALEVFTNARQDLASGLPGGWDAGSVGIATSFQDPAHGVLLNVQRVFDAGTVTIKFNFHHAVTNVPDALAVLRGTSAARRMNANLQFARELLTTQYGDIT